mgnify:CR=1 FL=1
MQQRDRFDYVLIETTGLANPGPVAAALWTDEQLESRQARRATRCLRRVGVSSGVVCVRAS